MRLTFFFRMRRTTPTPRARAAVQSGTGKRMHSRSKPRCERAAEEQGEKGKQNRLAARVTRVPLVHILAGCVRLSFSLTPPFPLPTLFQLEGAVNRNSHDRVNTLWLSADERMLLCQVPGNIATRGGPANGPRRPCLSTLTHTPPPEHGPKCRNLPHSDRRGAKEEAGAKGEAAQRKGQERYGKPGPVCF